uniref:Uncharacterized protein n=1 Tax=Globisporangium ultimum (strain ATCC 200006 / CBS 805.95 / DAOM BR144) TaxID=431595 RepID=K3WU19_GLOUD
MRRPLFIFVFFVISALLYAVMLFLRADRMGMIVAQLCAFGGIPVSLVGLGLLRYQVVVLIIKTYDFWFFMCLSIITFITLAGVLGADRATPALTSWIGMVPNILIYANLRVMRSWVIFSMFSMGCYILTCTMVTFQLVDGMREFAVLRYKSHELPATSVLSSGLFTTIAMVTHNVH